MPTPITLKVFRGDELVRTERFNREIIKIGRLASAHLCLEDDKISRIHSVIEVSPEGNISIIDMGSAEGTFVNGKKVSRGGLRIVLEQPEAVAVAAANQAEPVVNRAVGMPAAAMASAAVAPAAAVVVTPTNGKARHAPALVEVPAPTPVPAAAATSTAAATPSAVATQSAPAAA